MLSNILDRISFWSLFAVIVLLPVFFLPFTKIPIETSKGLLLVVGLVISIIFWAAARFSDGKVVLPKSYVLLSGLGIVLVFLISALFGGASKTSLFGVMFDIGTFWFVFTGYLLMFFSSIILKEKDNARKVMLGVIVSLCVVFVFQMLRILDPLMFSFGVLGGKTDNLAGSWNSLGLLAAFSGVISLFAIEFLSFSKRSKLGLYILILLSVIVAIFVNFPLVWELLGIFALLVFVYKISSYSNEEDDNKRQFPVASFSVVMISLLFFMSGQFIGGYIPERLKLTNLEISPSLSSTTYVTKEALKKSPIIGVGPNRFEEVWSMHKPGVINSTRFWNTSFVSGSGLIPTFFSTTGILGIISFLIFTYLLFVFGFKNFFANIRKKENFETSLFFISSVFLFIASFFYAAGVVIFLLFFAFTGIFIGLSSKNREHGEMTLSFLEDPRKSFFSILALVLIMISSAALSFKYIERFASVQYFGKALLSEKAEDATFAINKALVLNQNDLYLRTYSQVYLAKINALVNKSKTEALSETDKTELQADFNEAVNGATLATQYNSKSYLNFEMLGSVYYAVSTLGLTDAFDKAIESYKTASILNPLNPGLKLSIANSYNAKGMTKEAKEFVNEALTLKPDYTDALIIMSQIEKSSGNNQSALSYAQAALQTNPGNQDLIKYVDSLNGSSPSIPVTENTDDTTKEDSKPKQ